MHEEMGYRPFELHGIDNEGVLRVFLLEAVGKMREVGVESVKWDTLGNTKADDNVKLDGIIGPAGLFSAYCESGNVPR